MSITLQQVNESLNDIRPYIESDGGYLELVDVDFDLDENVRMYYGVKQDEKAAIAKVRLSGACESCAMSAQTLRMGIERHLTQTFPEIVGVIQVL
tara:strand:+ start:206 stop:490 length:285 start_codon:yes stop_codon:yes gene_type:complete